MATHTSKHMYDDYVEEQVDRGFVSLLDATILQSGYSDDDFMHSK